MNCAGAGAAPALDLSRVQHKLDQLEDQTIRSGLPLSAVWARVERARGAAHWRPDRAPLSSALSDPQRAPLPHDVADLLLPVVAPQQLAALALTTLLLAKVPLLPGTEWGARCVGEHEADCGEALLPLVAARARGEAAPAAALLRLLAEPPLYLADDTGHESWLRWLWDAWSGAAALAGEARAALTCWRLRWLRARMLLAAPRDPERARLRAETRRVVKQFGATSPLVYGELARNELAASGPERARSVATHALRAALADPCTPLAHVLYLARIVKEVTERSSLITSEEAEVSGESALKSAVMRSVNARSDCIETCEAECELIEREIEAAEAAEGVAEGGHEAAVRALLPGAEQWACVRAELVSRTRAAHLLRGLVSRAPQLHALRSEAGVRYYEAAACALLRRAARAGDKPAVTALAAAFPGNVELALARASTAPWARRTAAPGPGAGGPRSPVAALASAFPALLRAAELDWTPEASERAARACERATSAAGGVNSGALVWSARIESVARAGREPRAALYAALSAAPDCKIESVARAGREPRAALYAALSAAPDCKWLHVRGAAWCGDAGAMADALLERGLRTHALPDELRDPTRPT
ncbi:uncharacterized protein LOC126973993 [Leptidea sinapis]|uniref:uncharacterized protein LOC126973993 n=1 Tax=Leptidea sinapis TaxID=189913 RepID=UPI0021C481E3|nr:uncharacterized protein LOC126973993 [Leptidea sinapis]